MFHLSSNRKLATISIFVLMISSLVYYIIYYAYNKTNSKSSQLLDPAITTKCVSNICIEYNDIKECIHIEIPTLFRVETTVNSDNLNSNVKNIDYYTLKGGCQ